MIHYKSDRYIHYLGAREPIMTTQTVDEEELLVHTWRVARLTQLGIPGAVAEVEADRLDWHQVARLVQHGCPPRLAMRIAC
jgi:hypothetical protein